MGLFSSTLHIYKSNQKSIVDALGIELRENRGLNHFSLLNINNQNFSSFVSNELYKNEGVYYLITQTNGTWNTILELNVCIENPFYLYTLTNQVSVQLQTYALSFYLHDGDILYYNLDKNGTSLDGYSSNIQYFLQEPADKFEIESQRHEIDSFQEILPYGKSLNGLLNLLEKGYWNAFDNNDLDETGLPNSEIYYVNELERFESIGKYLQLYNTEHYPFADWHTNLESINLSDCVFLRAY